MASELTLRERTGRWGGHAWVFPLALLLPATLLMLALYAFPFLASIQQSFLVKGVLTLANYQKAIELYLKDIVFTVQVSMLSTLLAAAASITLAAYLRLSTSPVARLFGIVYRLPIFIPMVVVAQMMRTFLAPHGLLNLGLAQAGLIDIERPLQLFELSGLTFGFVYKQAPFMTLIVLSGFQMVDNAYIEAVRSVGGRTFHVIFKVLLPMSATTLAVATILAFTSTVGTFTLPYMLIGGKVPTTITVDIAHRVTYYGDYGVANALGVFSYLIVLFAAVFYLRSAVKKGIYGY